MCTNPSRIPPEIRLFNRADRDQLTELVNAHAAAVVPGWALPVSSMLAQLGREPSEYVVDPWVVDRVTLVAVVRDRLVAAAVAALTKDPQGFYEPYECRAADVLVGLVTGADHGEGATATVVVHADAAALSGEGVAEIEGGPALSTEALRRLACDGDIQVFADGPHGKVVGVGRSRRIPPRWAPAPPARP